MVHSNRLVKAVCVTTLLLLGSLAVLWRTGSGAPDALAPASAERGEPRPETELSAPPGAGPETIVDARTAAKTKSDLPLSAEPKAGTGIVYGWVRDGSGRPPARATVALAGPTNPAPAAIDADGYFEIEVAPGTYRVRVEEDSLPDGYSPPKLQDRTAPVAEPGFYPDGFYATDVVVPPEGGRFAAELRVFRSTLVRGRVTGPHGEPVSGASVRMRAVGKGASVRSVDTRTDTRGAFQAAGLTAGAYVTRLWLQTASDPEHRTLSIPPPWGFELVGGEVLEVPTIQVGSGPKTVRGRVVNRFGEPVADLPIQCYAKETGWLGTLLVARTDERGHFELPNLSAVEALVNLTHDYDPAEPVETRRLAFWTEPVPVALSGPQSVFDIGTHEVAESHPYVFIGTIDLDPGWSDEHRADPGDLRIRLRLDETIPVDANAPPYTVALPRAPRVDRRTGEFRFAVETPHHPIVVDISSSIGRARKAVIVVAPSEQTETRRIPFP